MQTESTAQAAAPSITILEDQPGSGEAAVPFAKLSVHYTGTLTDGKEFDSSRSRGPFELRLGAGEVIPGWEMALATMKVGGKRKVKIPSPLAYGPRGAGGVIPPNADLIFEIELLAVTPPAFENIGNAQLAKAIAEGAILIDIRRDDEWKETGVIEGSVKLTAFDDKGRFNPAFVETFQEKVASKDTPVVLICRTGNRSAYLAMALSEQLGYQKVANVSEGIVAWLADKRPVVK